MLVRDDGEVVGVLENIEEYNLDKILSRADLVEDIQRLVQAASR